MSINNKQKNSLNCVDEYWGEMKALGMCENEGHGRLGKTYKDVENTWRATVGMMRRIHT